MTKGAIVCQACGAKVSAARTPLPEMPRGAGTSAPTPKEAHLSGRAAKIAGGVLAVAVVATAVILWRSGDAPPAATRRPTGRCLPPPPPRGAGGVKDLAEPPQPPPFELASGLTPVPESATTRRRSRHCQDALERDPQDAADSVQHRPPAPAPRPAAEAVAPLKQAFALKADNWSVRVQRGLRARARRSSSGRRSPPFRAARALMPTDAATSYDLALALQRPATRRQRRRNTRRPSG